MDLSLLTGPSTAHVSQTPGKFFKFDPAKITTDHSQQAALEIIKRLKPLNDIGPEYTNFYIPALPCHDLFMPFEEEKSPFGPFMKTETGLEVKGSGKRSAIYVENDVLYRLKGCGNLTQGFNVEDMAYPSEGREIRGCCFENTVIREQYMTWVVQNCLAQFGYRTANAPLGI